jgi:hypothetical protein
MNARDAIRVTLETSRFVMSLYLSDLSDTELLLRPAEGANHAAWQLGHLVVSEAGYIRGVAPDFALELPPRFEEIHAKGSGSVREPGGFLTKREYLELMNEQRGCTLRALAAETNETLNRPGPEKMRSYAPTAGHVFALIGSHEMLHAGQIAVVRRMLSKPVLM